MNQFDTLRQFAARLEKQALELREKAERKEASAKYLRDCASKEGALRCNAIVDLIEEGVEDE